MIEIIKYDGTFEGLLTSIFHIYEYKLEKVEIIKTEIASSTFFDSEEEIVTDAKKATRVWKGISKKISPEGKMKLYKTFLSEIPQMENTILGYIRRGLTSEKNIETDFTDQNVLLVDKIAKKVSREKHRMDAFVRFRLTQDGIYFATIEPDFNVLPLNAGHFKKRYADQKWLIFDLKRNYGIYYNLEKMETITLEFSSEINQKSQLQRYFTIDEMQFQELWGNYFKNSNIKSRKNMKLHIKHIPKRYWKYLSEKNC
ncbi:TIGR03915 family putative DNA repair protein [Aequorivita sp. SDUM287046]|uniref:TIGR03915 family putative DNA repair protein n=1 Tax=Aequorivita aurantiaca TaxID=3053356 RepID=A0ABT8DH35_9FLAO|nr:TIGR03915 family putative DNA repair protein [Aequorivita aurantiaca]MDN3724706.1 TIGR03915 family putative DNA repair protein [Aequorivita aurantiaca]